MSNVLGPTTMNLGSGPMPYPAPVGNLGGNALLDWTGAGNLPSVGNALTMGSNFLPQMNWQQLIGQTSMPNAPQSQARPPMSPQGMGQPAPTLPNPDIGTFRSVPMGMNPDRDQHGTMLGSRGNVGGGPMSGRGIPMPKIGAGPGSK